MTTLSLSLPLWLPRKAPRAAFGKIVLNEARLARRRPVGLVGGIGIPSCSWSFSASCRHSRCQGQA